MSRPAWALASCSRLYPSIARRPPCRRSASLVRSSPAGIPRKRGRQAACGPPSFGDGPKKESPLGLLGSSPSLLVGALGLLPRACVFLVFLVFLFAVAQIFNSHLVAIPWPKGVPARDGHMDKPLFRIGNKFPSIPSKQP